MPKRGATEHEAEMASKTKKTHHSGGPETKNYWTPLQALADEDEMSGCADNEPNLANKKVHISPIKVLNRNTDLIQKLILSKGITNFLTKKISIGTKIISESMATFNNIKITLTEQNLQYFTHEQKY